MPNATQFLCHFVEKGLLPLALRLTSELEALIVSLGSTDMRVTKEIERFRLAIATLGPPFGSKAAKLDQACLLRMQFECKLRQPFSQIGEEALRILAVLKSDDWSGRPGESHPQALTDPGVNVSAHPALIVQPSHGATGASGQRAPGRAKQLCVPIARPCADVATGVCISPSPSVQDADPDSAASGKVPTCSSDRST